MNTFDKALIIGGGLSGLLCAKVLSEFYQEVIILEKSTSEQYARGSAQSPHLHVLMEGGRKALESLFPGIDEKLKKHGAPEIDWAENTFWKGPQGVYPQYKSGVTTRSCSRDLLEKTIKEEIFQLTNVHFQFESKISSIKTKKNVVSEIFTENNQKHTANLIINTTGRNVGVLNPARKEKVDAGLLYSSIRLQATSQHQRQYYSQYTPLKKSGAVIIPIEKEEFILTCLTQKNEKKPQNFEDMKSLVSHMKIQEFSKLLECAKPCSEIFHFGATSSEARIPTEKLSNYLILGDALVSTNPTYGQGMSLAAISAVKLRKQLSNNLVNQKEFNSFAKEVFKLTASEDLKISQSQSQLSFFLKYELIVRGQLQKALFFFALKSKHVHKTFLNKLHLRTV